MSYFNTTPIVQELKMNYTPPTVLDFGADKTGTKDSSAAFNIALERYSVVFIPAGTYRIDKTVFIRHAGTRLYGEGRHSTIIIITNKNVSDFGTEDRGAVFSIISQAPGPHISDFMIRFDNDLNPSSRSVAIKNRPAIRFNNVARGMIEKLAIYRASTGISLDGNAGGVTVEDVECSSLDIGLHISGESVDSIKVTRWHQWIFDFGVGHTNIAYDSLGRAIKVNRADDLHVSDSLFYRDGVEIKDGFGAFSNCDFDEIGSLIITPSTNSINMSNWSFTGCFFSNAGHHRQPLVDISNSLSGTGNSAEVSFSSCTFGSTDISSMPGPLIRIRGYIQADDFLSVAFTGCNFRWHDNPVNGNTNHLLEFDNSLFTITGCRFYPMLRGVVINTPIVNVKNHSRGTLVGCVAQDWGANTRNFINVDQWSKVAYNTNVAFGYTNI